MYWRHFNLTAEPFSLTPDPSFLYLSPVHAEAYAALMMGLRERRGLTTMIGEVGTGKTTLVYSVLSGLGPEINTAYVSNARLSFDGILRVALRDFGVPYDSMHSTELTDTFNAFLLDCANKGTTAALVIDEAQNLSFETFEDLRLLTNFETYTNKLLQIVLVGQPELDTKLRDPALRQVSERIAVRCVVNPLSRRESRAYLEHRLAAVNGSLNIFTGPALRLLIARSRGIPRSLNILAHNAMLFAYGEAAERVTRRFVTSAVSEKEGRGLVRLWRRPQRGVAERADARAGLRSSFWTLSAAAACGVILGLAIAGGETLVGRFSTPSSRAARATASLPTPGAAVTEAPGAAGWPEPPNALTVPVEAASEPAVVVEPALVEATLPNSSESHLHDASVEPEASVVDPAPLAELHSPTGVAASPSELSEPAQPAADTEATEASEPPPGPETPAIEPAKPQLASAGPAVVATPPSPPTRTAAAGATPGRPTPQRRPVASAAPSPPTAAVAATASANAPQDTTAAQNRARVIRVPAGSSLSGLLLTVYGRYSSEMLDRVRAENPQVSNPDFIIAGDELRFPASTQEQQSTQPAGGQTTR